MDEDRRKALEAAGWKFGSVKDFLQLTDSEVKIIEARLAARRLPYCVMRSEDDEEYVGLCDVFPSLSYLDRDPTKALKGIMRLVEETVEDELTSKRP